MTLDTSVKGAAAKIENQVRSRIQNDIAFLKNSWTQGLLPAAKQWAETASQLNRELAPPMLKMK